jgi:hypothetical protein
VRIRVRNAVLIKGVEKCVAQFARIDFVIYGACIQAFQGVISLGSSTTATGTSVTITPFYRPSRCWLRPCADRRHWRRCTPKNDTERELNPYVRHFGLHSISLLGDGTVIDFLWVALHDESYGLGLASALNPNVGGRQGHGTGRDLVWRSRRTNPSSGGESDILNRRPARSESRVRKEPRKEPKNKQTTDVRCKSSQDLEQYEKCVHIVVITGDSCLSVCCEIFVKITGFEIPRTTCDSPMLWCGRRYRELWSVFILRRRELDYRTGHRTRLSLACDG